MKKGRVSAPATLRLRITAAAESIVRGGHPWIFANSVKEQNRAGDAGELAVIYDRKDNFLAVGLFDPGSPIRVRVLHAGKPATIDAAWWAARLEAAVRRRDGWFDEFTTGYRYINGESDGWPGLRRRRRRRGDLIRARLKPDIMVLRFSRNIKVEVEAAAARNSDAGRFLAAHLAALKLYAPIEFLETGIRFEADVVRGQKTGFFLDQRANRRRVESMARGRTVLNAFSFSGGFSLYAARGGALAVADLDISPHALASARRNFTLNLSDNTIAACRHECFQADAFEWLAGNEERKFDLIVLDPPSLAKRETERAGAIQAYARLAASGIAHLGRGGILVACSCSAHVSEEEFFQAVRGAAARSGRRATELETTGHPPDHPATIREAAYLKAILFRLEP